MRRLARFAAAFALGCAAFVLGRKEAAAILLLALSAGIALGCVLHAVQFRRCAPFLLGLVLAFGWCMVYETAFVRPVRAFCANEETQITAEVREYPTKTRYGYGVLVRVKTDDRSIPAVLYYQEETALSPGDVVSCTAKLRAADAENLGQDEYYVSRGVWMRASCRGQLHVEAGKASLWQLPVRAAKTLKAACRSAFPEDVSGFLTALLTGDKEDISYQTRNELSITGIYHVVAVSGMHVSLLAGLVMLLCAGKRKLSAMLGLPLVWFFVFLTGANASSVRAGMMQTVLLLSPLARREYDPATAFSAALTALLLENPWSVYNVGLLLSFASTGGILLFARPLYHAIVESKAFSHWEDNCPKLTRALRPAVTAICCSAASSAFSLPICAAYFGLVSVSGFLTNSLCLWLVSLVFSAGLPAAILAAAAPGLGAGFGWVIGWPARGILWIVHAIAKIPCGAVSLENPYAMCWAALFYLTIWIVCLCPKKLRGGWTLAVLAGTFALCMGLAALDYRASGFTFTALDVGQGQCLIYTEDGQTSVIDCGGAQDESGETAARYLTTNGVFSVERLVLTHLDADHCNGAAQFLSRVKVQTIFLPATAKEEDSAMLRIILEAAARYGTETEFVQEDRRFSTDDGSLMIFGPDRTESGNDGGLCVLASHEKYDILITGDLSQMAEYRLLSRHDLEQIEILVAGHHGAQSSTSRALLERTQPAAVVISVGQDNSYGHPAQQTLARIRDVGAAIYRTDEDGTIIIRGGSNGEKTNGG